MHRESIGLPDDPSRHRAPLSPPSLSSPSRTSIFMSKGIEQIGPSLHARYTSSPIFSCILSSNSSLSNALNGRYYLRHLRSYKSRSFGSLFQKGHHFISIYPTFSYLMSMANYPCLHIFHPTHFFLHWNILFSVPIFIESNEENTIFIFGQVD